MSYNTTNKKLYEQVTVGAVVQKYYMSINRPQSGALFEILPRGVRMIMRNAVNQIKTTQEELVNDTKADGTIVSKNTTGNALQHNGMKPCSARRACCGNMKHQLDPSCMEEWKC